MIKLRQRAWAIPPAAAIRAFSISSGREQGLRIGYVPEHFATPLFFAQKHFGLDASLVPFPSGTGHMAQSLEAKDIDVGIGLTEGWVAGLAKEVREKQLPYKLAGTYVETPLCWAISTGAGRDDMASSEGLRGRRVGVSRIGSGSYVMGFVLADNKGWLKQSGEPPFDVVPLDTFKKLREAVNGDAADFFMWEHFTSKRYYDNGEIKRIGEIYTPWSSWMIVARDPADERFGDFTKKLNEGVAYFQEHHEEAVQYISTSLDYSEEDARAWLKTVEFARDVRGVDRKVIQKTIDILGKAGVLDPAEIDPGAVIAVERAV